MLEKSLSTMGKHQFMFMQGSHYTGNTVVSVSSPTTSMRMACSCNSNPIYEYWASVSCVEAPVKVSPRQHQPCSLRGWTKQEGRYLAAGQQSHRLVCRSSAQHGCTPGAVSHAATVAGRACARVLHSAFNCGRRAPGCLPRCHALPPGFDQTEPDCRHAIKSTTLGYRPV